MRIKLNGGVGAVLCDGCSIIVYTGIEIVDAGVFFNGTKAAINDNLDKLSKLHRHGSRCYCQACHDRIEERKTKKK